MTAPVCLVVLDGWGLAAPGPGNAVDLADTPVFDRLWAAGPRTTLAASGRAVGLPEGQMGNSEVGHLNLGAGRVVLQDLVRIDEDVASGGIYRNQALLDACARGRGAALHLVGLVSDGGVHSHIRHLHALIEMARREGVERVHVHAFTDGRDVSPTSGAGFLDEVPDLATVCGRYFGMDRDRRWDRTKRAYDAIVHGVGAVTDDPVAAVRAGLRARHHRRVHRADRGRRPGAGTRARRRRGGVLQLPAGSLPAAVPGAARARLRRVRPRRLTRRCRPWCR